MHKTLWIGLALMTVAAQDVGAQPLGTYRWQMQPYCNIVSVQVTQLGSIYRLEGTDDQCGATTAAGVVGMAFQNLSGSIGFGLTIVQSPGGAPVHIDATISISTLSGTWRDSAGGSGNFVFTPGAGTGGTPRTAASTGVHFRVNDMATAQGVTSVATLTNWSATPAFNIGGGVYNAAAGSYTVPAAGLYLVTAAVRWTAYTTIPANAYKCVYVFVNAARAGNTCNQPTTASFDVQPVTSQLLLASGDVITIRAYSSPAGTAGSSSSVDAHWAVSRIR